jgi:hypothetical protein
LIAEGLGLFIAGTLVPDLPMATLWAEDGRAIIETATRNLILEDGVGAEQSPTYTAFTLEMIAFVALVAAGVGRPVSQALTDRLTLGADYLRLVGLLRSAMMTKGALLLNLPIANAAMLRLSLLPSQGS